VLRELEQICWGESTCGASTTKCGPHPAQACPALSRRSERNSLFCAVQGTPLQIGTRLLCLRTEAATGRGAQIARRLGLSDPPLKDRCTKQAHCTCITTEELGAP